MLCKSQGVHDCTEHTVECVECVECASVKVNMGSCPTQGKQSVCVECLFLMIGLRDDRTPGSSPLRGTSACEQPCTDRRPI